MNRPRIGILCPRLQLPDAVGYDVIHQAGVLAGAGYPVRIFAESWSPATPAHSVDEIPGWLASDEDILVYHYSVHSPRILELLRGLRCRRVLRYHNVTPPEFVQPYDRAFASALRAGRDLLSAHLAAGISLAIADSKENADDLLQAGALPEMCTVVAPFHRIPELLKGEADVDWMRELGSGPDRKIRNLLSVGRLVPNKGYTHLLRGFAAMPDSQCRLILVGGHDPRMHVYYRELRAIIEETGIASRVWIAGSVSLAALRAMYRCADLLVTTSEHEGFCLPLIEAMAHGVPIAALGRAAIPETLGDAGLVLDSTEPTYLAAALRKLLSQPELSQKLGANGRVRYTSTFTNEGLADRFLQTLTEYVTHCPAYRPSSA